MIKYLIVFLVICTGYSLAQIGKKLNDECIPGTCEVLNSNCKWQGSSFRCVCKEKFMVINETHCGKPASNYEEPRCKQCLEKDSLCMDYDNDGKTDDCWCPKNETCGLVTKTKQSLEKTLKALKNVDLTMILLDVNNNRPIMDGNTVFLGDQVLIDIKASIKDPSISMNIENCTVTALTNADDIFVERIDLVKRGCSVHNDILPFNINFRAISDTHFESNVFEVFKLRSSSLSLINCWLQICINKTKCARKNCVESSLPLDKDRLVIQNHGAQSGNILMRNIMDNYVDPTSLNENSIMKDTGIRIIVEDPYGIQAQNIVKPNLRKEIMTNNVIELELKTKPISGIIKSALVSAIAIVFAVLISLLSILIYRACTRDNMSRNGPIETPVSICQPSEECKYDLNGRGLEESFFQNPVEPLAAQSHGSRW